MTETIKDIAGAVSQATTGADTPNQVTVVRPTRESVWAIFGALGVVWMIALAVISIIGFLQWPEMVAKERISALALLGDGAVLCIGIIVIALASSRLGRVDASAGTTHLTVEGRNDEPAQLLVDKGEPVGEKSTVG